MPNQFTKYTGTVTGQVGSLITALDAIAVTGQSWTKPFTGTNKAVYKAPSGGRLLMRIDDNASGAGGAKEALAWAAETMSDVDTASLNQFPSSSQFVRKSATADATTRSYKAWADSRSLYFFCTSEGVAGQWFALHFGEFYDLVASPSYNCGIIARSATGISTASESIGALQANQSTAGIGYYIARGHTGTLPAGNTGGVLIGRHAADGVGQSSASNAAMAGVIPYPNPADGGLYACQIILHDTVTAVVNGNRGRMRGWWCPLHAVGSYNDGDTFTGVGDLTGKTFEIIKSVYNASGTAGVAAIETSATLETN